MRWLTEGILSTYKRCNPQDFVYKTFFQLPKHVITTPSIPLHNGGCDNENYDLIIHMGETIGSTVAGDQSRLCWKRGSRYTVMSLLGKGTFGQVFRCRDEVEGKLVAVKVLKNRSAYFRQGLLEIGILTAVNTNCDPDGSKHTLRLLDHFMFRSHLCVVNELLGPNLYEQMKVTGGHRGVTVKAAKLYLRQLLEALAAVEKGRIVHCDLKPENVLVDRKGGNTITLIDFGSSCVEDNILYSYIQSRHYRAPEVILGLQYSCAIDMWSLGCLAAELFLGIPLFPGSSEYNQLYKITSMLGMPPPEMIEQGSKGHKFFRLEPPGRNYVLKSLEEYEAAEGVELEPDHPYVPYISLEDLALSVPMRSGYTESDIEANAAHKNAEYRRSFCDFLRGTLSLDPRKRWTAAQAMEHPFVRDVPLEEDFVPPPHYRDPIPVEETHKIHVVYANPQAPVTDVYSDFLSAMKHESRVLNVTNNDITLVKLASPVCPSLSVQVPDPVKYGSATAPKMSPKIPQIPSIPLSSLVPSSTSSSSFINAVSPRYDSGSSRNRSPNLGMRASPHRTTQEIVSTSQLSARPKKPKVLVNAPPSTLTQSSGSSPTAPGSPSSSSQQSTGGLLMSPSSSNISATSPVSTSLTVAKPTSKRPTFRLNFSALKKDGAAAAAAPGGTAFPTVASSREAYNPSSSLSDNAAGESGSYGGSSDRSNSNSSGGGAAAAAAGSVNMVGSGGASGDKRSTSKRSSVGLSLGKGKALPSAEFFTPRGNKSNTQLLAESMTPPTSNLTSQQPQQSPLTLSLSLRSSREVSKSSKESKLSPSGSNDPSPTIPLTKKGSKMIPVAGEEKERGEKDREKEKKSKKSKSKKSQDIYLMNSPSMGNTADPSLVTEKKAKSKSKTKIYTSPDVYGTDEMSVMTPGRGANANPLSTPLTRLCDERIQDIDLNHKIHKSATKRNEYQEQSSNILLTPPESILASPRYAPPSSSSSSRSDRKDSFRIQQMTQNDSSSGSGLASSSSGRKEMALDLRSLRGTRDCPASSDNTLSYLVTPRNRGGSIAGIGDEKGDGKKRHKHKHKHRKHKHKKHSVDDDDYRDSSSSSSSSSSDSDDDIRYRRK